MSDRRSRRSLIVKSPEDIAGMKVSAGIVSGVHEMIREHVVAGAVTQDLDKLAEEYIRDHGGEPAFKGYEVGDDIAPYPATLCISVNEVVVHGIPGQSRLKEGDIVTVDVGVVKDGYFGDCASTYAIGEVDEERRKLMDVTLESLLKGIEKAIAGNWVFDIARAVQTHVESHGFSVVRDLVGHGIGTSLHEDPAVPNFVPNPFARHRHRNVKLVDGMVLCVEPMVNAGTFKVITESDGWTVRTGDRKPSAHFEHMILIRPDRAEVLTTHLPDHVGVAA